MEVQCRITLFATQFRVVWNFLLNFLLNTVLYFYLNNQTDVLIFQIYSVIKLYMSRASSLPIISSFLLYIRHC